MNFPSTSITTTLVSGASCHTRLTRMPLIYMQCHGLAFAVIAFSSAPFLAEVAHYLPIKIDFCQSNIVYRTSFQVYYQVIMLTIISMLILSSLSKFSRYRCEVKVSFTKRISTVINSMICSIKSKRNFKVMLMFIWVKWCKILLRPSNRVHIFSSLSLLTFHLDFHSLLSSLQQSWSDSRFLFFISFDW